MDPSRSISISSWLWFRQSSSNALSCSTSPRRWPLMAVMTSPGRRLTAFSIGLEPSYTNPTARTCLPGSNRRLPALLRLRNPAWPEHRQDRSLAIVPPVAALPQPLPPLRCLPRTPGIHIAPPGATKSFEALLPLTPRCPAAYPRPDNTRFRRYYRRQWLRTLPAPDQSAHLQASSEGRFPAPSGVQHPPRQPALPAARKTRTRPPKPARHRPALTQVHRPGRKSPEPAGRSRRTTR